MSPDAGTIVELMISSEGGLLPLARVLEIGNNGLQGAIEFYCRRWSRSTLLSVLAFLERFPQFLELLLSIKCVANLPLNIYDQSEIPKQLWSLPTGSRFQNITQLLVGVKNIEKYDPNGHWRLGTAWYQVIDTDEISQNLPLFIQTPIHRYLTSEAITESGTYYGFIYALKSYAKKNATNEEALSGVIYLLLYEFLTVNRNYPANLLHPEKYYRPIDFRREFVEQISELERDLYRAKGSKDLQNLCRYIITTLGRTLAYPFEFPERLFHERNSPEILKLRILLSLHFPVPKDFKKQTMSLSKNALLNYKAFDYIETIKAITSKHPLSKSCKFYVGAASQRLMEMRLELYQFMNSPIFACITPEDRITHYRQWTRQYYDFRFDIRFCDFSQLPDPVFCQFLVWIPPHEWGGYDFERLLESTLAAGLRESDCYVQQNNLLDLRDAEFDYTRCSTVLLPLLVAKLHYSTLIELSPNLARLLTCRGKVANVKERQTAKLLQMFVSIAYNIVDCQ
jgi:hypothetical protein